MSRTFTVSKRTRPDRAPDWQVAGTSPDGKRIRRFFPTKTDAETFAQDANTEVREIGWKAMGLADDQRTEAAKCFELLAPKGRTLTEAVKHFLHHLELTERSVTVKEAVADLMQAKEGKGLSSRHIINLRYHFKPFAEHFGKRIVATLTRREIERWMDSRKLHPASYKAALIHLSLLFNYAVKTGAAPDNPVKDIQAPLRSRDDDDDCEGILSPAALRALLLHAKQEHPDMLAALVIQAFAGLRTAEVKRLDWKAVNLSDGHITVSAGSAKTRSRRVIAIQPNLAEWLAPLREDAGKVASKCFDPCFAELRRKLAKEKHEWPKNALRHSFASYRLMLDGDENRAAAEAGHSVAVLHAKYKGLANAKDAAQWFAIRPNATGENIVALSPPAKKDGKKGAVA